MYIPRSEEGRGLVSIEDCASDERRSLALYGLRSNDDLLNAATAKLKLKKFINNQNR